MIRKAYGERDEDGSGKSCVVCQSSQVEISRTVIGWRMNGCCMDDEESVFQMLLKKKL